MNIVQLKNITKKINGEPVLSDVCMQMQGGKIYGIVGKNGSGKSMLFRAVADLIHIDSGMICLNGKTVEHGLPREMKLGLIIENINLHMDLNAMENLTFLAKINGYISQKEIRETLIRVDLDPENTKKVKTYSLGMRQKLIIAQAIMEKPDILLLDEPTNALDAANVQRFYQILKEEAKRGAIIFVASHNQNDIDGLCDEVFYMKNGVLSRQEVNDAGQNDFWQIGERK